MIVNFYWKLQTSPLMIIDFYWKLQTCPLMISSANVYRSSQRSMTVFRNFKNQSQGFMTIFRNFKNQSSVLWLYLVSCIDIKTLRYFGWGLVRTIKKHNHHTMDKKRFKTTLKVLNDVKQEYPATKKYIQDRLEKECSKENISVDEEIFLFTYREAKS